MNKKVIVFSVCLLIAAAIYDTAKYVIEKHPDYISRAMQQIGLLK